MALLCRDHGRMSATVKCRKAAEEAVFWDIFEDGTINLSAEFVTWLKQQNAHQLHEIAIYWNWDNGTDILTEIVKSPHCDRATAMTIYGLSEPDAYEGRVSDLETEEDVKPLYLIAEGFQKGAYSNGAFGLAKGAFRAPDHETLQEWKSYRDNRISSGRHIEWQLPDRAFEPLEQKKHHPNYELADEHLLMVPFQKWKKGA